MEQLVWAIIIIVFIIFTALKNRVRNQPESTDKRGKGYQTRRGERDTLNKYLEEILGVEIPEREPQIRVEKSKPNPVKERIAPKSKPILKEKICEPELVLDEPIEEKGKTSLPEKKDIYDTKHAGRILSTNDFRSAIILSEIIGPPISKRKNYRLF